MSTSEYGYRILTDSNDYGGSGNPLDALSVRVVLSNMNHAADEFGQVCSVMSGTVAALSGKAGYLTSRTPTVVGAAYPIVSFTFPVKVRASGRSYKFRVRIGGASGNTASTKFYAVLSRADAAWSAYHAGDDAVFETAATTTTSPAWLTGASMGPNASATLIEMSDLQVASTIVTESTLDQLGGTPTTVNFANVTLTVLATTTNVAHIPRLYAVYLAEVIGT